MASPAVAPRSDGECELSEGSREPMPGSDVGGKFVVAATQVLNESVPRADYLRGQEPFQATHRPQPTLQFAVISFDHIIRILIEDMQSVGQELIEHPDVGWRPVGGHLGRSRSLLECMGEESTRGRQIPFLRSEDVDDLPELIDRPVQIDPLARDFDVRLIDEPPIPCGVPARPRAVDEQRGEPLHPAIDGHVIHVATTLGQQLLLCRAKTRHKGG
jgi:hypothetical protein